MVNSGALLRHQTANPEVASTQHCASSGQSHRQGVLKDWELVQNVPVIDD
ncbi:hypothetical protein GGQ88_002153 [Novosphingobium hassiacum]|uniref:Uncharacterized protein n=1 Tax=Novosphingobium hassiacum TaxID=173676 RepID=A0A7W6EWI8_9SPHN|nr:hypothetical protein [Novosphingobium hassiacum]